MKTRLSYSLALIGSFLLTSLTLSAADNLLQNGDFEEGESQWSTFIPDDAQNAGCSWSVSTDAPHEGSQAGQISCMSDARFALVNFVKGYEFVEGKKYKVTAWVKAGADFQPLADTPGYIMRVSMFGAEGASLGGDGGLFYLGSGNKAVRGPDTKAFNDQELPKEWTKLEGVFEASPGIARLNVCLFIWKGTGSFFIDDVTLEEVADSTELTPTE